MIFRIKERNAPMILGAAMIFGFSLIALYSASAIYHFLRESKNKNCFRKLDHSMIYVLIVGTYTPVVMYVWKLLIHIIFLLFCGVLLLLELF
ncbi:MAG: hemolysin III family protein [Longibaculum sp.]